jgi:hypothetical protein
MTVATGNGGNSSHWIGQQRSLRLSRIVLPPVRPQPGQNEIGDEERFMLAAYSAVTPDNPEEDAIWEKYIPA